MWFPYANIVGPSEGDGGPVLSNGGNFVRDFFICNFVESESSSSRWDRHSRGRRVVE